MHKTVLHTRPAFTVTTVSRSKFGLQSRCVNLQQTTGKLCTTVLRCDMSALQEEESKSNKRWEEIHLSAEQHTCRAEKYIHKSNFFPPLFLLFSSAWPFSSFITPPNRSVIFLFPLCQHPSAWLSETSAIILLSYYRGAFIQSVTFRETSDIHGGTAVLVCWYASAQQIAGCKKEEEADLQTMDPSL